MITHTLKETADGFEVQLACRDIVYFGKTKQEAYDAALTGVGELCRSGFINPKIPDAVGLGGCGAIGHIIDLTAEAVSWNAQNLSTGGDENTRTVGRQRMAALSTALAALARVDLP